MKKKTIAFFAILSLSFAGVGMTALPAMAQTEEPTIEIVAHTLSLNETVHIKYAVAGDALETDNLGLLIWNEPQKSYEYGGQTESVELLETATIDGVEYPVFRYEGLAAKQMTDTVYARAYVEREGEYYYSEVDKYSVLEYAYNKLGKTESTPTDDEGLEPLLKSLLAYGGAAQEYFGYKTDALATDEFIYARIENATFADGFSYGLFKAGTTHEVTPAAGYELSEQAEEYLSVGESGEILFTVPQTKTVDTTSFVKIAEEEEVGTEGLEYTLSEDGTYYSVTGYTGTATDVVIPSKYEGLPVTVIGDSAFYSYERLVRITSIKMPNSITKIETSAFGYCDRLANIEIPDSVTTIGRYAFASCVRLANIEIPDGVTSIGEGAFDNCNNLTGVYITDIAAWCNISFGYDSANPLYYAKNLYLNNNLVTELVIPEGVTEIKAYAFRSCSSLTSIEIPNSVTSIGNYAFYLCSNLSDIVFGENSQLTSIGGQTFYACSSLTGITIPESVTSIGELAFDDCSSLTSVEIGDNVTSIGEGAFGCCSLIAIEVNENNEYYQSIDGNLYTKDGKILVQYAIRKTATSFTIPDSVTSIGRKAFANCGSLTEIVIRDSVTSIGRKAFANCGRLTIYCEAESQPEGWSSDWNYYRPVYWYSESEPTLNADGTAYDGNYWKYDADGNIVVWVYEKEEEEDKEEEGMEGLEYTLSEDGTYYSVTGYTGTATDVVIPSTYEGLPVTVIGEGTFWNCSSLTSIEIPSSVTSISNNAFNGCGNLTSVEIPDSVTSIGYMAFHSCRMLTDVVIGDNVTSIGEGAFGWCDGLIDVEIPDSVTTIGDYAFCYCRNLHSVKISDNITSIGRGMFSSCYSLASVVIPDGVTSIGDYAFYDCYNLTIVYYKGAAEDWSNITIGSDNNSYLTNAMRYYYSEIKPALNADGTAYDGNYWKYDADGNIFIWVYEKEEEEDKEDVGTEGLEYTLSEDGTYYSVTGYTGTATDVVIPSKYEGLPVAVIGDSAFASCSSLTSVVIPDSVTSIGDYAFRDCYGLTSIDIPDGVTSIGDYAFYDCDGLTSVVIPDSVTSIGNYAFRDCSSLTGVYITDIAAWCNISGIEYLLYYGSRNKELYLNNELITKLTIPDGVTSIGDWAFSFCGSLTEIVISDSVTTIGGAAFYGCSSLTSIDIPDGVTSIEEGMFAYCDSLTSVVIPDGVTSIGGYAFDYCSSLTSVVIPDSVTSIGVGAFDYCSSLTSVVIPDSVTSIGVGAFAYCSSLTSVVIGDSVTSIEEGMFAYCDSLTSVTIGDSITSISEDAFYDCDNLTNIYITDIAAWCNISEIEYLICYGSSNKELYLNNEPITELVIPDSVTSIGKLSFAYFGGLTSVVIGDNVTSIGAGAFGYCSNLTSVTISDSVTSIGRGAFAYCDNLTNIYITDMVAWCNISGSYNFISNSPIDKNLYLNNELITELVIPDGITSIGMGTFVCCSSLTSVVIPDSVTSIGSSAFAYCSSLTSVFIGDNVTSIEAGAFGCCSSLTEIVIPSGVTSIGNSAFYDCSNLTSVYYKGTAGDWFNITIESDNSSLTDAMRYYYSETEPTLNAGGTAYDGNYWHYVGDKIVVWVYGEEIGTEGLEYTLSEDGAYYSVTDYTGTATEVVIPSTYEGLPVAGIGNSAFENCSELTSVVIPDSVTNIGNNAFNNCSSLTSVYITDIAAWCNISFGGYSATPLYYAKNLYLNNNLATELVIPDGVTEIKAYAFYYCSSLTEIVIPDSVTSIGHCAFGCCGSLTSITIGDSVTSIGSSAFWNCDSLTEIVIPDGVTTIEGYAFRNCDSLTSVEIPGSVTSIGSNAFEYCGLLTSVEIPESVTSIGNWAFEYCSNLRSVVIGDGVMSIGRGMFSSCYSLTSVVIGNGVTSIGEDAFNNCYSLTNIYITDIAAWCNISGLNKLMCVSSNKKLYLNNELITKLTIPDGVTTIENCMFFGCSSLTEIVIPDSVTTIGGSAFYKCTSLTSIKIPDSVISIGSSAFWGCSSLIYNEKDGLKYLGNSNNPYLYLANTTSITIANIDSNCKFIGDSAFNNCDSLTSVEIPGSVTSIGSSAFAFCDSLTEIVILDGITSIGDGTFAYCSSLTSVTIPDSVTTIEGFAFEYCSSLTEIVIPDSVTTIGDCAFNYCYSLMSVVIGDSVTSIGDWAFVGCGKLVEVVNKSTSITVTKGAEDNGFVGYYALAVYNSGDTFKTKLSNDNGYIVCTDGAEKILVSYTGNETDLTLPSYITQINQYAFYDCDSLMSVVMGNSVTSIGHWAFRYCGSLTSVVIGVSVTSIGAGAFEDCSSLTSVVIPDGVTSIGGSAFYNCSSLTIYCEAESQPEGWNTDLNSSGYAVCWYSESEPTGEGNFWHYVDGVVTVWKKESV